MKKVIMNGPSGTFTTRLGPDVKHAPPTLEYQGRLYHHAGTQDGGWYYKEGK